MELLPRVSAVGLLCALALVVSARAAAEDAQYALDLVQLPVSAAEAAAFGLDVDGDLVADNKLGSVLAAFANLGGGIDLQAAMDAPIRRGEIILLANLETTSLVSAPSARLGIFLGENPSTPPCAGPEDMVCGNHLDGATSFDVDPAASSVSILPGSIESATFLGGPASVTIEISLVGDAAFPLHLIGARAEVDVTASRLIGGRLGGAIDAMNDLLPAIHGVLAGLIAADCGGTPETMCCTADSSGETLISLFDENGDCDVSIAELEEDSLITTLLAPDVDLLDADGRFNPNVDGVNDLLSLGVGFAAVGASFVPEADADASAWTALGALLGLAGLTRTASSRGRERGFGLGARGDTFVCEQRLRERAAGVRAVAVARLRGGERHGLARVRNSGGGVSERHECLRADAQRDESANHPYKLLASVPSRAHSSPRPARLRICSRADSKNASAAAACADAVS